jgi:hypothetical protein
MQTVWRSATIINQVKAQFAIGRLQPNGILRCWGIYFAHHYFKVIDQGLPCYCKLLLLAAGKNQAHQHGKCPTVLFPP